MELNTRCVFVVMKDLTCLVILAMCVSHLTAEYLLLETEDDDKSFGPLGPLAGEDGSGEEAATLYSTLPNGDKSGSDYGNPPSSSKPTTEEYDPDWILRYT